MKILACTLNTPLFREEGLNLNETWRELDLDDLSPAALDMLEVQVGRIVQVHPDHLEGFARASGVDLVEGKLVARRGEAPVGERHKLRDTARAAPTAGGLRTDGPTFEDFTKAGYAPETYPPEGYAEKPSKGLAAYRKAAQATANNARAAAEKAAAVVNPSPSTPTAKS